MTHIDISRRFMQALSHVEKRDIGPIDSAALAATVVAFQQETVRELHALGYLSDLERDNILKRLEGTL